MEIEYMQAPWVFGLCCNKDKKTERRFFIVERRDRQTFLPIIEREVDIGTTIHSDQWRAYS